MIGHIVASVAGSRSGRILVAILIVPLGVALICTARAAGSNDWIAERDPSGFAIEHPPGWQTRSDAEQGWIAVANGNGEQVLVWPFFVPTDINAHLTKQILQGLADRSGPHEVQWSEPQALSDHAMRMDGRAGGNRAVGGISWVTTPRGAAGQFYLCIAPEAQFGRDAPIFARILESAQIRGGTGGAPAAGVQFVQFNDPNEGAFSVEVPQGWQVRGGMVRRSAVEVNPAFELISPDGKARVYFGDPNIPTYTIPNQLLSMGGFNEGTWYPTGYGTNMLVAQYRPGAEFARWYIEQSLGPQAADLQFNTGRNLSEANQAINRLFAQYPASGLQVELQTGEVTYTCQLGGQKLNGYAFATTVCAAYNYGGGVWAPQINIGLRATDDELAGARAVLAHVCKTYQMNPQWVLTQQQTTQTVSRIVTDTNHYIADLIEKTFEFKRRTDDEIDRRRSNAILGLEDAINPATGEQFKVESGANYYWIDGKGNIVGTNTYSRPDMNFTEMLRLP